MAEHPDGPLSDTWSWRDLPVLRAAVAGVDAEPIVGIRFREVAQRAGLAQDDVYRSAKALQSAGLVGLREVSGGGSSFNDASGSARVLVGQWPSPESALDRIVDVLERMSSDTKNPHHDDAAQAVEAFKRAGAAFLPVAQAITGLDA